MDVVDKILFDSGQTEIRPEGLGVLKRVVEILMTVTDKVIRVEGHTDSIPIGGALAKRYPTNWELSAARALNVTRFLEKEGIDPTLLSAVAFGEHQPIAENDTRRAGEEPPDRDHPSAEGIIFRIRHTHDGPTQHP